MWVLAGTLSRRLGDGFVRHLAFVIAAMCTLVTSGPFARASEVEASNADVLKRARPEYDARGLRAGSFFVYPTLTAGIGYVDNVFNDATKTGDYFYSVAPALTLQSSWSRHELSIDAGGKAYRFAEQGGEDRADWNAGMKARIDVVRGTDIKLEAGFIQAHEARGTDLTGGLVPGDPAEPTEYSRSRLGAEFGHTFNRVHVALGGSSTSFDFDDTPRVLPFVPDEFNNDDRDRTVTEFFAKATVRATEDTGVFLRGRVDDDDFDAALDDDGFNRDSSGVGIDGGVEFRMTHVLVGEIFAGYTMRSYDDLAFADANEFGFGAGLKWFPSMLTTISFDGARTIEDTSITAASSFVSTRGQVGIDHELLRNLIFSGRVGYENAEYLGIGRSDDVLRGALSGRYLINNNFHLDAGWDYIDRSSTVLPFEYSTGQFHLSLTGKM
jgi:hypothetical protein